MDDHGDEADTLVLRRVHPARFALDPVCVSCTVPEDDPATFAISRSQALGATMVTFSCLRNWSFRSRDPIPPLLDGTPNAHLHWHVAPRYRDAVVVAGETFVGEDVGEELRWLGRFPSEAVASELVERLSSALRLGSTVASTLAREPDGGPMSAS